MGHEQGEHNMSQAQTVRKWAVAAGYEVGVRGRLAPAVWEAYAQAHDDFAREAPSGSASCGCGRRWVGVRECHCTVCHRHFGSVTSFDAHRVAFGSQIRCVDPVHVRSGGYPMKVKDTVWGPLYIADVGDREHFMTGDHTGLYDDVNLNQQPFQGE